MSTVLPRGTDKLGQASSGTTFRAMVLADIPTVQTIEREVFPSAWPQNAYLMELTRNQFAHYFVLLHDEAMIGFGGMWCVGNEAHVTTIGVTKIHQGGGYGRLLFLLLLAKSYEYSARCLTLEVRPSNERAIRLYASCGLSVIGRRRGYYNDDGEDALIMWTGHLHAPKFKQTFAAQYSRIAVEGMGPAPSMELVR